MYRRYCNCCGTVFPGCTILSDDFNRADSTDLGADWDEVSGSWSISSNRLSVAGAGMVITEATRDADYSYTVTANIDAGMSLVFDYLDSDNYHYAKFNYTSSVSASIQFYKVTGGSSSLLSTHAFVPIDYGISSGQMNLRLCVGSTRVQADGGPSYETLAGRNITPHGGTKAGALSDSASATIDDFLFAHYSRAEGCPDCIASCESICCDPLPVDEYVIDLGSFPISNNDCDDCTGIGGEYTVSRIPFTCEWTYSEPLDCTCERCEDTLQGQFSVRLQLTSCTWVVTVTLQYVGVITDPDCEESCPTQQFPYSYNMGSSQDCSDFDYTLNFTTSPAFSRTITNVCSGTMPASIGLRPA